MSTSSRREFIATAAAASLLPLIPGTAKPIPTPQPVPGTIPLWLVEHPAEQAWEAIDGHYPSRLLAEQSIEKRGRSKEQTIRQVACPSSGRVFRVVSVRWARYEDELDTLALHKTNHRLFPFAEFPERLRDVMTETGLPEARVLADVEKCLAAGRDWAPRPPRHLLDLPDVIMIGMTEQSTEDGDYACRQEAMQHAADLNREQLEAGEIPEEWHFVLEIGEPIEKVGFADYTFSGEIGVENRSTYRPVRVVRPTADEIAQYGQAVAGGVPC